MGLRNERGPICILTGPLSNVGPALGIALFGSIGVVIYRMAMADRIPASLAADSAESARATLGGAMAAAGHLPADQGAVLIDAGRVAFIDALQLCAAISVIGSLALAVFVAVTLRHVNRAPASAAGSLSATE